MGSLTFDLSMSLDGYVAGPDPSQEDPLGVRGERLHEWAFAAAGEKDVHVAGGAEAVQQYLAAGLIERFQVHVVPLLLGDGRRLLEALGDPPPEIELDRVVASPAVAHLRYRVAA